MIGIRIGHAWGIGVATLTAAFVALAVVAHRVPYFPIDLTLMLAVQRIHSPWFVMPLAALSEVGFPPTIDFISAGIVLAMFVTGHRWAAIAAGFAAAGIAGLNFLVKWLVDRPRPPTNLVSVAHHIRSTTFPAGHVMTVTAFFGFLCYLAITRLEPSWRRTAIVVGFVAIIVLMGIARIDSGEHWPSDVLGGYLSGALWLMVSIRFHAWGARRFEPARMEAHAS